MKKILSLVLVCCMLLSTVTVFADNTSSKAMEGILLLVKEKIEIPQELTEFNPRTYEDAERGNVIYNFMWSDKMGNAHIEASCDEKGRINRYYFYDNSLKAEKKLTSLSKEEIISFSEKFLKKIMPEGFAADNDTLVFDTDSWNVNNLNYNMEFTRLKYGIEVKDNRVSMRIAVYNDVPYVRSFDAYMNYDGSFEPVPTELDSFGEKYMQTFPIEMIYKDEYIQYLKENNEEEKNKTVLVYRHKNNEAGYILASNGEAVTEDVLDSILSGGGSNGSLKMEAAMDSVTREELFTEQELAELEKINGLISKEKVKEIFAKLPYTGYENKFEMSEYEIRQINEKYVITAGFNDAENERYISSTLDGVTGELLNLYNRIPYKEVDNTKKLSEQQKKSAEEKMDAFLKKAAGEKLSGFELQDCNGFGKVVSHNYDRIINGVRYISDGIDLEFDAISGVVRNYRMDFDEKRIFADVNGIIDENTAYNTILNIAPLKKLYVHTGGLYKVCYTVSEYGTEIDAFTCEEYNPYYGIKNDENYKYSDLEGHWAKEMINKLAETQIGFRNENFCPDVAITQADLLRLFAAGVRNKYYLDYSEEDIYLEFLEENILSEAEKNPESQVKREDAFVFMVRLDGLERVAKLHNIFKVEYQDGYMLTEGKIGYPAILTGMNIICGNGGFLRPQEPITRAEAAVMVYNYMMK